MARYTASPNMNGCWDINDTDADGVGRRCLFVGEIGPIYGTGRLMGENVARLLVLAMNLPGGIEEATTLLRAEVVRHS